MYENTSYFFFHCGRHLWHAALTTTVRSHIPSLHIVRFKLSLCKLTPSFTPFINVCFRNSRKYMSFSIMNISLPCCRPNGLLLSFASVWMVFLKIFVRFVNNKKLFGVYEQTTHSVKPYNAMSVILNCSTALICRRSNFSDNAFPSVGRLCVSVCYSTPWFNHGH